MLSAPVLGSLLLLCCVLFLMFSAQAGSNSAERMLLAHYAVREKVYKMEHGFENAVRASVKPGLSEPEQVRATCAAVSSWAGRTNTSVSVFFSDSVKLGLSENIIPFLTGNGLEKLAEVLEECTSPCAALISVDEEGCIVVQNRGLVRGSWMKRAGFLLRGGGVKIVVPEGTKICGGTGVS